MTMTLAPPTKKFTIWFRHRNHPLKYLMDVTEDIEARSKKSAIEWGKAIAAERGWWFMEARRIERKTT